MKPQQLFPFFAGCSSLESDLFFAGAMMPLININGGFHVLSHESPLTFAHQNLP